MCSESNAALVVQDGGTKSDSLVGVVAAHELGHSFNMLHDDRKLKQTSNWDEPERAPHSQYNGRNVSLYIYLYATVRHSVKK